MVANQVAFALDAILSRLFDDPSSSELDKVWRPSGDLEKTAADIVGPTCERMDRSRVVLWQTVLGIATIACWLATIFRANPPHVPPWARLWAFAAPLLGALSAGACLLYLRAAAAKPRPKLMHLAGVYFLCSTLACTFVAVMLWAAYSHRSQIEYTALACMLASESVAYGVLQLMIIRKVEALATGLQIMAARSWFGNMCLLWCAWVLIFVLRVTHLCETCAHPSGDSTILESVIGFLFVLAFLAFTAVSVKTMLQCADLIWRATGCDARSAREVTAQRVLIAHAVATALAQGASALQMVMTVLSQVPGVDVAYSFVVVHCVDIVCNVACALCLSGIVTALAEFWIPFTGASKATEVIIGSTDVLGEFAAAGKSAHTAAVYGIVGEVMAPVGQHDVS